MKYLQQQKQAADTIRKHRMLEGAGKTGISISEPQRLDLHQVGSESTPAHSQHAGPFITQQQSQRSQMNAGAVLSQALSTSTHNPAMSAAPPLDSGNTSKPATMHTLEKQKQSEHSREYMKSRAGSQRSSKTNQYNTKDSAIKASQTHTDSKMENQAGFNEVPIDQLPPA